MAPSLSLKQKFEMLAEILSFLEVHVIPSIQTLASSEKLLTDKIKNTFGRDTFEN